MKGPDLAFARALTRARARDLARDLDRACDLARDLDRDLDRALVLVLDLAHARDLARDLALNLAHARDLDLDLARARARDLALNLIRARDLARDLARGLGLGLVHDLDQIRELDRALANLCALVDRFHADLQAVAAAGDNAMAIGATPCRSAHRLLGMAIRLLPAGRRDRWREELTAELIQVAEAGISRVGQVRHGLRVLMGVPTLRRALRELAREIPR
ncbi:MAG: hypothetical protein ACR2GH_12340 [Pseudonocardia sp.]